MLKASMGSSIPAMDSGLALPKEHVPIIDLAGLKTGNAADRLKIANELRKAAESWGLFMVINHGVSADLMSRLQKESRRFFNLPLDLKMNVKHPCPGPNIRHLGYREFYDKEQEYRNLPLKESLAGLRPTIRNISEFDINLWPSWTSSLRDVIVENDNAVSALGLQILELLAESLGLQQNIFSQYFHAGAGHIGTWRLHHFPAHHAPGNIWRTVSHSDPSVLTMLNQDVEALQVKKPGRQDWIYVEALPGAYVINVGDILQAWSNGRFPSANHRVFLNPMIERFASVNFLEIDPSVRIEAPEGLIDEAHPALYVPFIAQSFREYFDKIKPLGDITRGKALEFALQDTKVSETA